MIINCSKLPALIRLVSPKKIIYAIILYLTFEAFLYLFNKEIITRNKFKEEDI